MLFVISGAISSQTGLKKVIGHSQRMSYYPYRLKSALIRCTVLIPLLVSLATFLIELVTEQNYSKYFE